MAEVSVVQSLVLKLLIEWFLFISPVDIELLSSLEIPNSFFSHLISKSFYKRFSFAIEGPFLCVHPINLILVLFLPLSFRSLLRPLRESQRLLLLILLEVKSPYVLDIFAELVQGLRIRLWFSSFLLLTLIRGLDVGGVLVVLKVFGIFVLVIAFT